MTDKLITETKEKILGDMDIEEFKKYGHRIIDWICDYLKNIEQYPVLSQVKPGDIKNNLPASIPKTPENMEKIFNDFEKIIIPGITHWNHPDFFAYFSNTGSMPGILGELLTSALNVNGMLWKTSPSLTELEEVTLSWLRQMIGLKENFFGIIYDTASISSMHAIAAARETLNLKIKEEGMAGRKNLLPLRLYASSEAHSSIEKAAITLGIGQKNVRKVACDTALQMDTKALVNLIEEDIKEGCIPFCVVSTVGTTGTTSIDPVGLIAPICKKYKMWHHVDAAYAGSAAIVPEMKHITDGWNDADSIVINPHKWLFTQTDLSVLYCKKPEVLKSAFSLVPEYLKTSNDSEVINLMDYGIQLGRRFRALKFWIVMRYFGEDGLVARIREHINLAKMLRSWMDKSTDFHALAAPFSTVCFRYYPKELKDEATTKEKEKIIESYLNDVNKEIMNTVNATGNIFISHTVVQNRIVLRLCIGNIRTQEKHVREAWEILQKFAKEIDQKMRKSLNLLNTP